jgi:hypothetical protein
VIVDEPRVEALPIAPLWQGISLGAVAGRPVFRVHPPNYVTDEIVQFVRGKVSGV